jgi:transglutaminase-like putative cysteine protease
MEFTENGFPEPGAEYLRPTKFFDYDHPEVAAFIDAAVEGVSSDIEKSVKLFYAVRDSIRYDPYQMREEAEHYMASFALTHGASYCIPKANLLVACARRVGISAAIGLSDVTNHMCTERLHKVIGGTDLFPHHGYAVMYLDGEWIKAAPAFNIQLCEKFGVTPTEFDGQHDALLQEFDKHGRKHMEYVSDNGIWSDFPYDRVHTDYVAFYPDTIFEDVARERALNDAKAARRFEDEKPLR